MVNVMVQVPDVAQQLYIQAQEATELQESTGDKSENEHRLSNDGVRFAKFEPGSRWHSINLLIRVEIPVSQYSIILNSLVSGMIQISVLHLYSDWFLLKYFVTLSEKLYSANVGILVGHVCRTRTLNT
ncbi:hypothetical protein GQ457_08G031040 [Hibiscus cannabinus]